MGDGNSGKAGISCTRAVRWSYVCHLPAAATTNAHVGPLLSVNQVADCLAAQLPALWLRLQ
jgi:hypothetical protein